VKKRNKTDATWRTHAFQQPFNNGNGVPKLPPHQNNPGGKNFFLLTYIANLWLPGLRDIAI